MHASSIKGATQAAGSGDGASEHASPPLLLPHTPTPCRSLQAFSCVRSLGLSPIVRPG
jgi:hypothetical protein